jgi:cyclase
MPDPDMSLTQKEVSKGVILFSGRHPLGVDVASTVVRSGNDAFVFDSLYYPEDTLQLLQSIKAMGLTPVGLINTHWHLDHTAGNQLFRETKRIISHSQCIDLMRTDLPQQLEWARHADKNLKEADRIRPVYPNETIKDKSILAVGDREIVFLHTPGHTPDSIIGLLEDEHIIVAGDTVMELPYIWYGDSLALIEALRRVKSIDSEAKIIQGHGGECDIEKLDWDIDYIENIRKIVAEYVSSGKTVEETKAKIQLVDCYPSDGVGSIPRVYTDIHVENLERVHTELTKKSQ